MFQCVDKQMIIIIIKFCSDCQARGQGAYCLVAPQPAPAPALHQVLSSLSFSSHQALTRETQKPAGQSFCLESQQTKFLTIDSQTMNKQELVVVWPCKLTSLTINIQTQLQTTEILQRLILWSQSNYRQHLAKKDFQFVGSGIFTSFTKPILSSAYYW